MLKSPTKKSTSAKENEETTKKRSIETETDSNTDTKKLKTENDENVILYSQLADVLEELEKESSRLKLIEILSNFFTEILKTSPSPNLLVTIIYLCINKLGPDYEGLELGLGETLLIKAISDSTGRSNQQIKKDYKITGDLGKIAQSSRSKQTLMMKPKPLSIYQVFDNLKSIAMATGNSSQQKKIGIIVRMLSCCNGVEAKFLIRSLEGKLRIGLADKSVLMALAKSLIIVEKGMKFKVEDLKIAELQIKDSFNQISNYQVILEAALKHGILNLKDNIQLRPGIPLKPMLAKPTKAITEILDKFADTKFTCEYKYDGERAQIHLLENGQVKIYSRNSEDMTERYPDLILVLKNFIKPGVNVKSLILDSEAVAWDRDEKKILPFQKLTTRKRKDVKLEDIKVQICVFAFDLIYLNGESLIKKSFEERRQIMIENLQETPGQFQFATYKNLENIDDIQIFLDQSIKDSCEGLMIKLLSSTYEPSQRSSNWLKLKKDYLQGIGDSIDLVCLGGYHGKGKRTGWFGGFLLGCYNNDSGEYETCCKIGTGFSDEDFKSLTKLLEPEVIEQPKSYYVYDKGTNPNVWFEPKVVFEVLTADLSLSPIYKAGVGKYDKGISLRFPRFVRVRDDKGPEDSTNSEQIMELYESQVNI